MGWYTIHIVINVLHLLDDNGYGCATGKGTTVLSCTAILFQLGVGGIDNFCTSVFFFKNIAVLLHTYYLSADFYNILYSSYEL